MDITKRTYEDNLGLEESIKYLIKQIEMYCRNKKPLIVHCIRVAFRLDLYGYDKEIVQAALLHDLLEDTKSSIEEVKKKFGKKVSDLVLASTFNQKITDKEERYKENFERAKKFGKKALAIRASDILDNSYYYSLVNDKKMYNHLLNKFSYFLILSKSKIGKEKIYTELKNRLVELKRNG